MAKLINQQTMEKISKGNFKGLNLSACKITLLGQISLAEQTISGNIVDAERETNPETRLEIKAKISEMEKTVTELQGLLDKLNNRILLQEETEKRIGVQTKLGARLKSSNELQEWMERQQYLKANPEERGSNVFTYKRNVRKGSNIEDPMTAANQSLIDQVELLRLKSQKSMSGLPTRAAS